MDLAKELPAFLDYVLFQGDHKQEREAVEENLALFEAELAEHRIHAFDREDPHQVVFEGEVEPRRAGVALPSRPAAQLVVDPA